MWGLPGEAPVTRSVNLQAQGQTGAGGRRGLLGGLGDHFLPHTRALGTEQGLAAGRAEGFKASGLSFQIPPSLAWR